VNWAYKISIGSTINLFDPPNDDNILQWQQQQQQQHRLHQPPESGIVIFWVDDSNEKDKNENNDSDVRWCGARSSSNVWKEQLWHGDDDADDDDDDDDNNHVRFEVAVVPATSTPINSALTRVPHLLRASVLYTTTTEELDLLCHRLDMLRKPGWRTQSVWRLTTTTETETMVEECKS
jgi:hypothetical protein